jgi:hypothetical protein
MSIKRRSSDLRSAKRVSRISFRAGRLETLERFLKVFRDVRQRIEDAAGQSLDFRRWLYEIGDEVDLHPGICRGGDAGLGIFERKARRRGNSEPLSRQQK